MSAIIVPSGQPSSSSKQLFQLSSLLAQPETNSRRRLGRQSRHVSAKKTLLLSAKNGRANNRRKFSSSSPSSSSHSKSRSMRSINSDLNNFRRSLRRSPRTLDSCRRNSQVTNGKNVNQMCRPKIFDQKKKKFVNFSWVMERILMNAENI